MNSHNFLVDGEAVRLVDWEKAVNGTRYLDLAHFLAPTTTMWKRGIRLSADQRERFFATYADECADSLDGEQLAAGTAVVEPFVILRALSWCYMACAEYAGELVAGAAVDAVDAVDAVGQNKGNYRPRHDETYARITEYLEGLDELIPS